MPSAQLLSNANMSSQLARDAYQANGLIRSHQQATIASSQTSLQKLPASSPQFLYQFTNNNHQHNQQQQQQQQSIMQFPPPPQLPQGAQQNLINKPDHLAQYNQMILPNQAQQQQQQQQTLAMNNLALNSMLSQQSTLNGINNNGGTSINNGHHSISSSNSNLTQPTILMPAAAPLNTTTTATTTAVAAAINSNKNLYQQHQNQVMQQPLYSSSYLHQHQQQTQQLLAGVNQQLQQQLSNSQLHQQQQVPMTTIMIPASTAGQLQNVAMQIQQAAMQSSPNLQQNPQILVFMIPYMVSQPSAAACMAPMTPEQASMNSTLVRQSHSNSSMMRQSHPQLHHHNHQQQQQQQQSGNTAQSRTLSSLSNRTLTPKQEPEKFYIKANFSYQPTRNRQELAFQKGDILHVLDTLQNNDYGVQYWLATRVKANGEDAEKGLIPNKSKAEEITIEQRTMDIGERTNGVGANGTLDNGGSSSGGGGGVLSASVGRVNFLKRRSAQRSKSLCKDNWDNVVFDIGNFRMQTYERVVFKHPGFCRPVVIFGPLSDLAREKLLKDYPEKYSYPSGISQTPDHPKVIRLKGILDVIDQGKHALLDITAQAVERLNYVNLAPIVIFMKTESKSIIKEFRSRAAKSIDPNTRDEDTLRRDGKSSRKLLEQSIKLEKQWFHVFTAVLDLSTMGSEMWYRKLRETIENQQSSNVWMGEKKSEKKLAAAAAAAAAAASAGSSSITTTATGLKNNAANNQASLYSGSSNSRNNLSNGNNRQQQQASGRMTDSSSALNEKFNECLNLSGTKSTNDLQQNLTSIDSGLYGNRSQLRNAYAHSLAQRLARASSEPKLNGLMSDNDDGENDNDDDEEDDDDDDDDDEIAKKPLFPNEFENTSSISSSNGIGSGGGMSSFAGQCSLTGTAPSTSQLQMHTYQSHHSSNYHMLTQSQGKPPAPLPPQIAAQQQQEQSSLMGASQHHHLHNQPTMDRPMLAQVQDNIYSMNGSDGSAMMQPNTTTFSNGVTVGSPPVMNQAQHNHRSDYHTLPPVNPSDDIYNGHHQQQQQKQQQQQQQQQQHNQLQSGLMHHHNNTSATLHMGNTSSANNRPPLPMNNDNGSSGSNNTNTNNGNNANNGSGSSNGNNNTGTNNVIDLTRNHDARGSAFQIYSDMNQNNYHYYNMNKI